MGLTQIYQWEWVSFTLWHLTVWRRRVPGPVARWDFFKLASSLKSPCPQVVSLCCVWYLHRDLAGFRFYVWNLKAGTLKDCNGIELQFQNTGTNQPKWKMQIRSEAFRGSTRRITGTKKKRKKGDNLMKPSNQSKSKLHPFTSWRLKPSDNAVSVACRLSIRLQLLSTQQYYTAIQFSTLRAWISLIPLNPNHLWIKHEWLQNKKAAFSYCLPERANRSSYPKSSWC